MGVSCAWIVIEAVRRIFGQGVEVRHSAWPVAVLLASMVVDLWRSRQLRAVAQRTGSPALATDASHFASDIWASLAVLAGLHFYLGGRALRHRLAALRRSCGRHLRFANDLPHDLPPGS